ncbi:hypothetical protein [Rhizobium metallidurans]|uniref:Uncharacterized protein n=1 Tax=Rhizobium metallidurans TaxID=1265931 RepID=A0A7W6GDS7_9HYPH|nr:hypothetical protein [Rhizobium metallidurans]
MIALLATPLGRWAGSIIGGLLLIGAAVGVFRWWLHEHDQKLLSGYVLLSEKTAAETERDEFKRQAESYKTVMDAYQVQYRNQLQKDQQDDAQAEQERKDHAAKNRAEGRDDGLTDDDIKFLRRRP